MGGFAKGLAIGLGGAVIGSELEMIFSTHVYINEKRLLLDKKLIEKFPQILEEIYRLLDKIDKTENDIKNELPIAIFSLIKETLRDLIPDDAILLNEEKVKKNCENLLKGDYDIFVSFPDVIFFSQKLYYQEERKSKINFFQYSDYKILEKNENFILVEYPQKKENDYFSILILGNKEKNIKFVNGFLNFLFDIKEEDNIRLKIERKENENFIEIIYISSNKGSFKFNCINIETESFKNEDIKQLLEFGKSENDINLIVLNQNEFSDLEYYAWGGKFDYKKYIFFASPNPYLNNILFQLCILLKESEKNPQDFNIIDFYNDIFSYYFDCDCIYSKTKNKEINILYKITMESYSSLLKIVKEKNKITLNFSLIADICDIINNIIEKKKDEITLNQKYKDELNKQIKLIEEKDAEINKIINVIRNMENGIDSQKNKINDQIKCINEQIGIINYFKKDIENNNSFRIPINYDKNEIKNEYGVETNICQVCKYNCHLNCDEYIKKFCKCYRFLFSGFQCKECPNKCFSNSHEVVKYHYPNYIYKTIDEIIKPYMNDEYLYVLPHLKVKFVINKKESEINDLTKKLEEHTKQSNEKIDKEKEHLKEMEGERNYLKNQEDEIENAYKQRQELIVGEVEELKKKFNEKMKEIPFLEQLISSIILNYFLWKI